MLRDSTAGTPSEYPFLSILQHLMLIRDDFWARWVTDGCVLLMCQRCQLFLAKSGYILQSKIPIAQYITETKILIIMHLNMRAKNPECQHKILHIGSTVVIS